MAERNTTLAADQIFDLSTSVDLFSRAMEKQNPVVQSQRARREKGMEVQVATSLPREAVRDRLAVEDTDILSDADRLASDTVPSIERVADEALTRGDKDALTLIKERMIKEGVASSKTGNFTFDPYLILDDPRFNPQLARLVKNRKLALERIEQEMEEANGSWISDVGAFVDDSLIRYAFIGMFEDATRRGERVSADLLNRMMNEDWEENPEALEEVIQSYKDEGVFDPGNIFALARGAEELTQSGFDPEADVDQFFAIFDLATLGTATGLSAVRRLTKAKDAVDSVTAVRGATEGGKAVESLIDYEGALNGDDVGLVRHLNTDAYDAERYQVERPSFGVAQQIFDRNDIIKEYLDLDARGVFGRDTNYDLVRQRAFSEAEAVVANTDYPLSNLKITPVSLGFGNWKVRIDFGKLTDGDFFKTEEAARARAEQIGPEAFPHQISEESGWVVRVERDVALDDLTPTMDTGDLGQNMVQDFYTRLFGAAGAREDARLAAMMDSAEAGASTLREVLRKPYNTYLRASGKERKKINDVMVMIRDGDPARGIKPQSQWYTKQEFIDHYKLINNGETPSQRAIDAYFALVDINDADWFLRASRYRRRYVENGYQSIEISENSWEKAKPVTSVPFTRKIKDLSTGENITLRQASDMGTFIYKLTDEMGDGTLYVINPPKVRSLRLSDVMEYNAGGSRLRPDANYFVGSTKDLGNNRFRFKGFISAFSSKQANDAVESLNRLVDEVQEAGRNYNIEKIDDLIGTPYEGRINNLLRGNRWNPDIETLGDLIPLSKKTGHTFFDKFSAKFKDERLSEFAGNDEAIDSLTVGESIDLAVNTRRTAKGIGHYGQSSGTRVMDPAEAIGKKATGSAFWLANRAYVQNSIVGWVKAAQAKNIKFPEGINKDDYYSLFSSINAVDIPDARLREMKEIIDRRLGAPTWAGRLWEDYATRAQEFVFDKFGPAWNFRDLDPGAQLMKVGFYSKFGFLNFGQFVLQSSHVLTIAAISPVHGTKGAAMAVPLNILMSLPYKGKMYNTALKRFKKFDEQNGTELAELVEYYRTSGRWNTANDLPELQGTLDILPEGAGKMRRGFNRVMDFGLAPFSQGERLGRSTAISTAFFEFKAKFPDIPVSSDFAKSWITNREQTLTFRMTTSNKSVAFSGPMRLPTQWLTYSFRAMEAIFVGRGLSRAERTRLAVSWTMLFGLSAWGAGKFASSVLGEREDSESYLWVKYGLMDGVIRTFSDAEVSLSSRLSAAEGMVDLYDKLMNDEFMTVVMGPSSEIAGDVVQNALRAAGHLVGGRSLLFEENVVNAVRNISTISNLEKAAGILHAHELRARDGTVIPGEFDKLTAVWQALGFSPTEVQEYYDNRFKIIKSERKVREFTDEMKTLFRNAVQLMGSGDPDDFQRGTDMAKEIALAIEVSPFDPSVKASIGRSVLQDSIYPFQDVIQGLIRQGYVKEAQIYADLVKDEEE